MPDISSTAHQNVGKRKDDTWSYNIENKKNTF